MRDWRRADGPPPIALVQDVPLGAVITPYVPHLALDDLPVVARGVDAVLEVRPAPDPLGAFVFPLTPLAHGQRVPEVRVGLLGLARAAHPILGAGAPFVRGADIVLRYPDHIM